MDFSHLVREPIKKVVWAIDPFDTELVMDEMTVEDLRQWFDRRQIEVHPIHVFRPRSSSEVNAVGNIERMIEERFLKWKISTAKPTVLTQPSFSVASGAFRLLESVERLGAGLIVVSSAGRRGIPRFIFGSFAEVLLNASKVPILFLNRNQRPKDSSIKRVLWASDFSEGNRAAFQSFFSASNHIADEISLFYDISLALEVRSYLSAWDVAVPSTDEILRSQEFRARDLAGEWLREAQLSGYKTEPYIGIRSEGGGILAAAAQVHAGLIAMGSETSSFDAAIFGSWARDVLRASQNPVWIYGPQFMEEVVKSKPTFSARKRDEGTKALKEERL